MVSASCIDEVYIVYKKAKWQKEVMDVTPMDQFSFYWIGLKSIFFVISLNSEGNFPHHGLKSNVGNKRRNGNATKFPIGTTSKWYITEYLISWRLKYILGQIKLWIYPFALMFFYKPFKEVSSETPVIGITCSLSCLSCCSSTAAFVGWLVGWCPPP